MKNIFESKEVFELYAIIDLCYCGLNQILKELDEEDKKRSVLDILIDKDTGYNKSKLEDHIKTAIGLLEKIIDTKKNIDAEYNADIETLNKIYDLAIRNNIDVNPLNSFKI